MKFTKLGENEIRCVLSEEEMTGFGINLDDILEKNSKSGLFFNEILSQAAAALGESNANALRGSSAQISVLKDRSISILFHTRRNEDFSEFADKLREVQKAMGMIRESDELQTDSRSMLIFFKTIDDAAAFCRAGREAGHLVSRFLRNDKTKEYVLFILRYICKDSEYRKIRLLAEEFGTVKEGGTAGKAWVLENSEMLISDDAFYILGEI